MALFGILNEKSTHFESLEAFEVGGKLGFFEDVGGIDWIILIVANRMEFYPLYRISHFHQRKILGVYLVKVAKIQPFDMVFPFYQSTAFGIIEVDFPYESVFSRIHVHSLKPAFLSGVFSMIHRFVMQSSNQLLLALVQGFFILRIHVVEIHRLRTELKIREFRNAY